VKQTKVVNQYEKFRAASLKYLKLSKLMSKNTDTNSDKEKQIMQAKFLKAEQQELVAQDKFNSAVQELADSLINSICRNFVVNKETRKKIKLSLLQYCSNNQEAFKSIVKNTIPNEVKENLAIEKVIDNAVGNILSNLHSF
jgi:DNA anti-recombination protein RmuC